MRTCRVGISRFKAMMTGVLVRNRVALWCFIHNGALWRTLRALSIEARLRGTRWLRLPVGR